MNIYDVNNMNIYNVNSLTNNYKHFLYYNIFKHLIYRKLNNK